MNANKIVNLLVVMLLVGLLVPVGLLYIVNSDIVSITIDNSQVEITKMDFKAKADITNADSVHFFIELANNTDAEHYIWFDVDDLGTDPTESGIAHEVTITSLTTETEVALAVSVVIDAILLISAESNIGVCTITNSLKGIVEDATQGLSTCLDSLLVSQEGTDPFIFTLAEVNPTISTLLCNIVPIMIVISVMLYFVPKARAKV